MTKKEIYKKLDKLDLSKEKYIVINDASLVVQGIIGETTSIDLACPKEFYDTLDWPTKIGAFNAEVKYKDCFDIDALTKVVNRAIEQLPERCREIFSLSRKEGLSYRQIAERLGISVKTVETQISIALKRIREILSSSAFAFLWLFIR